MDPNTSDFYEKAYNPFLQAGIILAGMITVVILSKLVNSTGLLDVGPKFAWMSAASFMLFFAVFNSVFSLSSKNLNRYWGRSIMAFMGLAAVMAGAAYLFSGMTIDEAGSYRWIFFVVTFGYLVFLSIMGAMKNIVEFAQKEEWNHPRIRRKNNKRK
ncbi:MAG: hypothetical protein AB8G22_07825 [Saprospiraceae bacterium]